MRRLVGVVLVAVLALGCSVAGANANASAGPATPVSPVTQQDTASAKTFIALQERYDIDTIHSAAAITAAEDAVIAQVRSGCLDALKDAPRKPNAHQAQSLTQFLTEAVLALNQGQLAPVRTASVRVGERQHRLRFSEPALQWQVDVDGSALVAYVELRPPDLCADAHRLAASHFTKITAAGTRFVNDASTVFSIAASYPSTLVRQMRPYAPAAVSAALKRLPKLQHIVDEKLTFGHHFRALVRALGLAHLAATSSGVSS